MIIFVPSMVAGLLFQTVAPGLYGFAMFTYGGFSAGYELGRFVHGG